MEVIGRAKQDARAESNAWSSYRGITMKYFTINRSVIDKSIDTDPID